MKRPEYNTLLTLGELNEYLDVCHDAKVVGFDAEADVDAVDFPGVKGKRAQLLMHTARIVGVSLWTPKHPAVYVPLHHESGNIDEPRLALAAVATMLRDRSTRFYTGQRCFRTWAHNLGADLQMFRNAGFPLVGDDAKLGLLDSRVAAWQGGMYESDPEAAVKPKQALKASTMRLGLPQRPLFEEVAKGRLSSAVPPKEMAAYAAWDAFDTAFLGETAWPKLIRNEQVDLFAEVNTPIVEILRDANETGFPLDPEPIRELIPVLEEVMERTAKVFESVTETIIVEDFEERREVGLYKNGKPKFKKMPAQRTVLRGARIQNDRDVSRWMYDELGEWPTGDLERNKFGFYGVGKDLLKLMHLAPGSLGHRARELRLEYQEASKLLGTYAHTLLRLAEVGKGRIHASILATGTETGRFSSKDPNTQNLPARSEVGKAVRRAFVGESVPSLKELCAIVGIDLPDAHLDHEPLSVVIGVDLSQAELRLVAHYSRDPSLCRVYHEGLDVHGMTLETLHKHWAEAQRGDSKIVNFSTIYNISDKSLGQKMLRGAEEGRASKHAFFENYPEVRTAQRAAEAFVREHGYIECIDGFRRPLTNELFPSGFGRDDIHWRVRNAAFNTLIQGSVGAIMRRAMVRLYREISREGYKSRVKIVAQEHDSLVLLAAPSAKEWAKARTKWHLENAFKIRVPMVADVKEGATWLDTK